MKREVFREVRLPAFALGIGELELLCKRIRSLFDPSDGLRTSIRLSLPNEKLQFESMDELKSYDGLRGRVTDFSIEVSRQGRMVKVKSGGTFSGIPTLRVEAETDVWCAAAIETVLGVVRANRVWYSWFLRVPLTLLFLLLSLAPTLVHWLVPKAPSMTTALAATWFSTVVVLGYLSFTKEKLLPAASVVFSQELGFIRRYGSELGLALGIISLLLAIYTWLNPIAA